MDRPYIVRLSIVIPTYNLTLLTNRPTARRTDIPERKLAVKAWPAATGSATDHHRAIASFYANGGDWCRTREKWASCMACQRAMSSMLGHL